jgi:hypothetical protein
MIETAAALVFGHAVGDFVLQTDAMVRRKREPAVLLAHVACVVAATWAALGFAPAWDLIALVALSHLALDAAKLSWGGPGFRPFALDQAGHLAALALGAALFPGAYDAGLWARLAAGPVPEAALLPQGFVLGAALILAVWAGGYAVAALMTGVQPPVPIDSLPRGGRMIGKLERLLILMLVLAGEPDGIGFLIAAKSILRFNELAGTDRHVSEYVIIGTLASFAWAIGVGYAAQAALAALGA